MRSQSSLSSPRQSCPSPWAAHSSLLRPLLLPDNTLQHHCRPPLAQQPSSASCSLCPEVTRGKDGKPPFLPRRTRWPPRAMPSLCPSQLQPHTALGPGEGYSVGWLALKHAPFHAREAILPEGRTCSLADSRRRRLPCFSARGFWGSVFSLPGSCASSCPCCFLFPFLF